jgi:serine/threonine-protein kinase
LGPYRLGPEIARGALGRVVHAVDTDNGRDVALRILKPALASDILYLRRLEEQLAKTSRVEHTGLEQLYTWGPIGQGYVIASAFIPGIPLTSTRDQSPIVRDCAGIVLVDIARALAALHTAGIVHQGLSPDKVIHRKDCHATIVGAGLVTFGAYSMLTTRFDQVMGGVGYLAPEVIRGEPPAAPSNIYALGCLAFVCLTGKPPFNDAGVFEVALAHLEKDPPRLAEMVPGIAPELDRLVASTLAKDPAVRPTSEEMATLLTAR